MTHLHVSDSPELCSENQNLP